MDDIFEFEDEEIKTETSGGNVKISNEVVAAIAGISAEEVKGVARMYTSFSVVIAEKLGTKKSQGKGVKVVIGESGAVLDLYIIIDYGVRIREVAESVQNAVKNNVETMTGLDVLSVNVHVEGVSFENAPADDEVRIIEGE